MLERIIPISHLILRVATIVVTIHGLGTGPFFGRKACSAEKPRPKTWTCPLPRHEGDSPIFTTKTRSWQRNVRRAAKIGIVPCERLPIVYLLRCSPLRNSSRTRPNENPYYTRFVPGTGNRSRVNRGAGPFFGGETCFARKT